MPKSLTESRPLAVAEATPSKEGTIPVVLIDAGWGSSGYYSESVLKNAAKNGIFGEGLQMYVDHPGTEEMYDRPERSIRDIAAVLATPGTYDESVRGVVAEARPVGVNGVLLQDKEFLKAIGLSIRAYGDSTIGEAEGRKGQIITELTEAISVDFVTKAGRGGKVLVDLMESARPEQVNERAVAHGIEEATANESRMALQRALEEQYGGEKAWVWVRDFDETKVWFAYETPDGSGTYEETYSLDSDGRATLGGSPVEVYQKITYVPVKASAPTESDTTDVPAPAGQSIATETEESNMAQVQIEEAELQRLRDADAQRVEAERRAQESERRLAERDARDTGVRIINEESEAGSVEFSALETEGLLSRISLGENGFDADAFRESVKKAVESKGKTAPAPRLNGFGVSVEESDTQSGTDDADSILAEADRARARAFGRKEA